MYNRMHVLETIYEDEEDTIFEDDSSKFTNQRSRLSYYICLGLITGCFFIVIFIITMSFNPSYVTNNSRSVFNTALSSKDKLKLSTIIINHLGIFSHQINEQLTFQPNTLTFFTSTISNSLLDVQNQTYILLIYIHLKYPQSCIDNIQCIENLQLKLKTTFMKLSNFLTKIELDSYHGKQIQLNQCNLIENSTTITLVSLVSIRTQNQSATETTITLDHNICENIDQTMSISKPIDNIIRNKDSTTNIPISILVDNQIVTSSADVNKNSIKNDEENNINHNNPKKYSKYIDDDNNNNNNRHEKPTRHCNNVDSQCIIR
ncbi:unnamed protein product [Rotaria sordida]|uniref:Uncharacterized protein n=2 Tax=Rotaria sordida TaxID=392033 RepID=A0A813R9S3_9BILA|nr:unnamed protein product [Rotaria sordida]